MTSQQDNMLLPNGDHHHVWVLKEINMISPSMFQTVVECRCGDMHLLATGVNEVLRAHGLMS